MCGIFGMVSKTKRPVGQIILEGLKTLEYRGYDSWGVAISTESDIDLEKETGKIGEANLSSTPDCRLGIGHTRWATHGGVTRENAHPHLSFNGRFAVVHNGIVENYLEIKERLISGGLPLSSFISETDSEVVAHLLAKIVSDKKEGLESLRESILDVFKQLSGLNALLIMDKVHNQVIAIKNGSPLVIGFGKEDLFFASDAVALLPHTKKVYFLDDGEMYFAGKLYDLESGEEKEFKPEVLDMDVEEISKGGYDHYLVKEIHEAPVVIRTVLDHFDEQKGDLLSLLGKYDDYCLIGCGTASYAALAGQYLFATQGYLATAYSGSESAHFIGNLRASTLPIFLSQSGETIDLIEQVNLLKKDKREILAIVNRISSTLDRKADASYHLHAGPEISVVSSKAFLAKLTTLILLSYSLSNKQSEAVESIVKAIEVSKEVLSSESLSKIEKVAEKLSKAEHMFTLGRGKSYPIALEAALKSKEAAYVHNEGFAGGELKHGVISLIEEDVPCLVLVGGDDEDKNILSNAIEVKSRGGYIIGVASENHPVFDEWISYKDCGVGNILTMTIVVQLLAYYMSILNGLDPDKPRNLAKSVTVK
ncbi:MAG: glutamine--fructose-6-phosphate transaminase (isomerizing) [Candidatus Pacebacteria bacterium]|nr:glutamine--fructose-6-phosphate transaminase (isomerizing) [Candidatus Paceibacterota bacterium]